MSSATVSFQSFLLWSPLAYPCYFRIHHPTPHPELFCCWDYFCQRSWYPSILLNVLVSSSSEDRFWQLLLLTSRHSAVQCEHVAVLRLFRVLIILLLRWIWAWDEREGSGYLGVYSRSFQGIDPFTRPLHLGQCHLCLFTNWTYLTGLKRQWLHWRLKKGNPDCRRHAWRGRGNGAIYSWLRRKAHILGKETCQPLFPSNYNLSKWVISGLALIF